MAQATCVLIKPGVPSQDAIAIKKRLAKIGTIMKVCVIDSVTDEQISAHYAEHRDKPYFQQLKDQFIGKRITALKISGDDIVQRVRDAAGHADPAKADPGTIRAMCSQDSLERAIAEKRAVDNVIHSSDSEESAKRELNIWIYPETLAYERAAQMAAAR